VTLEERFQQFSDHYREFDRIEAPLSRRPDLHALLLLDEIVPEVDKGILGESTHEFIFLNIDMSAFAYDVTDDQILELVRCGVRIEGGFLCF
jgi:hypothetical protein